MAEVHGKSCLLLKIHSAPSRATNRRVTIPLSQRGRSERTVVVMGLVLRREASLGSFANPEPGPAGEVGDALEVVGAHVGVGQFPAEIADLELGDVGDLEVLFVGFDPEATGTRRGKVPLVETGLGGIGLEAVAVVRSRVAGAGDDDLESRLHDWLEIVVEGRGRRAGPGRRGHRSSGRSRAGCVCARP